MKRRSAAAVSRPTTGAITTPAAAARNSRLRIRLSFRMRAVYAPVGPTEVLFELVVRRIEDRVSLDHESLGSMTDVLEGIARDQGEGSPRCRGQDRNIRWQ